MFIQTTYPLGQQAGQLGDLSRPLAPHDGDTIIIGAAITDFAPGQAFKLDASGLAVKVTDLADSANLEGVLSYEAGDLNQDVSGGINVTQGVLYATDDVAKYWRQGYVYVQAGEVLARGAEVGFNPTTGKWEALAGTGIFAAKAVAADGDLLELILRASA